MEFASILHAAGVAIKEEGDWRHRVRPGTFAAEGIIVHHTASKPSATNPAPSLKTVINGRPDLNGPLCNLLVDRKGVWHIISAGRSNHAGAGSSKTLADVRANRAPAGSAAALKRVDDFTGANGLFIGIEVENDGVGEQMPSVQWNSLVKGIAALLKAMGKRSANRAIAHAEWTSRKPDPRFGKAYGTDAHTTLNKLRSAVASALTAVVKPPPHRHAMPLLKLGSTGIAVSDWQKHCNTLQPSNPVKVTGKFDEATRAKTKVCQHVLGVTSDGVVGDYSWAAMHKRLHLA